MCLCNVGSLQIVMVKGGVKERATFFFDIWKVSYNLLANLILAPNIIFYDLSTNQNIQPRPSDCIDEPIFVFVYQSYNYVINKVIHNNLYINTHW